MPSGFKRPRLNVLFNGDFVSLPIFHEVAEVLTAMGIGSEG